MLILYLWISFNTIFIIHTKHWLNDTINIWLIGSRMFSLLQSREDTILRVLFRLNKQFTNYYMFEHGIRYSRDLTYVWDYLGLVQQSTTHLWSHADVRQFRLIKQITIYNMFEHGIRYRRDLTYVWDYISLAK